MILAGRGGLDAAGRRLATPVAGAAGCFRDVGAGAGASLKGIVFF